MKFITPSYYSEFQCIAEKCTDNCCIGWEIGIDADTASFYRSVGGDFGKRLQESITEDDTFILQGERCPFLNNKNLCDIIIHCGKDHLCQICRDHPRYFEWYGDLKEGGIGLSCEEGARLILTTDALTYSESQTQEDAEEIDEELFHFLCTFRKQIFDLLEHECMPVSEKLCKVLSFAESLQFIMDNPQLRDDAFSAPVCTKSKVSASQLTDLLTDFEPIDASWTEALQALQNSLPSEYPAVTKQESQYLVNLCRYFLWRYFCKGVFDGEILSKVKFAVASVLVIRLLCEGSTSLSVWIEKAKLYSKEMEYSDENRELLYDYTYEKEILSTPCLLRLLEEMQA